MKFLFDENLSHKLVRLLADIFPDSVHVRDIGLKAADDSEVWKYAQDHTFIICSKDSDLHQQVFYSGSQRLGTVPLRMWRCCLENTP